VNTHVGDVSVLMDAEMQVVIDARQALMVYKTLQTVCKMIVFPVKVIVYGPYIECNISGLEHLFICKTVSCV
jgi:hypothetical protein